jgi:hypothetical protein
MLEITTDRSADTCPTAGRIERLVLYDPIGLTDVRYSQPWPSAEEAYKATMAQNHDQIYQGFYAGIRRYFPPGAWKPEYEQYVRIL